MEIKSSDGKHVGTVDRVDGNRIKLTKSDPKAMASTITWTLWR